MKIAIQILKAGSWVTVQTLPAGSDLRTIYRARRDAAMANGTYSRVRQET